VPDLLEPGVSECATGDPEIVRVDQQVVLRATGAVTQPKPADPGVVQRATSALEGVVRLGRVGRIGLVGGVGGFAHG
jgi:hypothetical protein